MAAPFRSAPAEGVRARLPRAVSPGSIHPRRGRCRWGRLGLREAEAGFTSSGPRGWGRRRGAKRPRRTEPTGCGSAVRFPEAPAIHGEARNEPDCHHPVDKRPDPRRQGGSYSRLIIAESKEQAGGG